MSKYPINATNILAVGYDEVNQILEIEFRLNVIHYYFEVPLDEFVAFMKADDTEDFYFDFIQFKYHFDVF
ncbi:KTSC domain-containing protein [Flavobacterium sp.]|uniref:KTSC domain-containing protein n=1 Tax=Flavobacterium sp. TaxID=239 RepID=UPI002619E5DD|nr:KTSC domain-containing protein [Flavobacterium sp.]